ncbi:MAG: hypothetical protein WA354_14985 [Terracidiphilus sp.]
MATKKVSPGKSKSKLDPGLLRAHKAYEAAINSNETDRVMAMYDKDAEILQPGGPLVTGRRNIRKWVNDYFTECKTHWKKVPLKNFVMGEYGFDEGIDTAVDISKKDGKITRSNCKGILIYKKQKNGEWLIFRDIWNDNK